VDDGGAHFNGQVDRCRLNGAIYLISVAELIAQHTLTPPGSCFVYKMNREDSIDIDEQFDFDVAEMLMHKR
jgi:CMP-N-acetylneuraminic acid synthetase